MLFRILGALEIVHDGADLTPTTPKLRQVIALLLLRHGRIVQTSELTDELWGEDPPPSALATLQTYIYKLRKLLGSDKPGEGEYLLRTKPNGYVVDLSAQDLDLCQFGKLVERGQALMEAGDHEQTSRLLTEALAMWRGPVLADVVRGAVLRAEVNRLEEWRLQTLETRIDADLALGRHRELLAELKSLAGSHPHHEGFQAKLMMALHRAGRRYEALDVYHRLSRLLDTELGLEPSAELMHLHRTLLSPERASEMDGGPAVVAGAPGRALPTPAQLPPGIIDLTGREAVLARIERRILGAAVDRNASCVVAVTGGPGVGKTTLAVHAAHQLGMHFPDGQLFVDLRGSTATPADPTHVLDQMIRALGVPAGEVPATREERSRLLRTVTANRRVLLVLDDAGSPEQVAALLPGTSEPAVLVTGRRLTVPTADHVVLDRLDVPDGVQLLAKIVGPDRVTAEPEAAARIVELCGGLPLALRAIGTRLAVTWLLPLERAATQLADAPNRLRFLRIADLDVRASLDASLDRLEEFEQAAFLLLGTMRSREFTAEEAAALLGTSLGETTAVLTGLVDAYLLRLVHHGEGPVRYAFDELIQLYARERLEHAASLEPATGTGGGGPHGVLLLASGVAGLFRAHRVNPSEHPFSAIASGLQPRNGHTPH